MFANKVHHGLRAGARLLSLSLGRQGFPERRIAARQQSDRRGAQGSRAAFGGVRPRLARLQARPGDAPGEAFVVEPCRLIIGDARGQDFRLPCPRRRFEAFELSDSGGERVRTFHPRIRRHMLPGEQEPQKVARRDRLDFRPQTIDGIAADACEQAPLAPFVDIGAAREPPAHGEAFGLQRKKRRRCRVRLESERRRERGGADRTQSFQPAAQDFDESRFQRPLLVGAAAGAAIVGSCRASGHRARNCRQALGGDPDVRSRSAQPRHAALPRQRLQPAAPASRFVGGEKAEPGKRVVQLVLVGRIRPCFRPHPRDRFGIEPADVGGVFRREPAPAHHGLGARRSSSGASSRQR